MLCLCVLCKYVNGNVYKHSVLLEKHKAYEFVRIIYTGACVNLLSLRTHARYLEKAHALLITCSGEVYGILLRERRNLSR